LTAQVVDFTFDRVDLEIIGRQGKESHGPAQVLPVPSNVTWEELRMMVQHFVGEKRPDGSLQRWSLLYDKYHTPVPLKGHEEVSARRLQILHPALRDADLARLKAETKRAYSIRTELDFRQVHFACRVAPVACGCWI
jgi:hypothetical protein